MSPDASNRQSETRRVNDYDTNRKESDAEPVKPQVVMENNYLSRTSRNSVELSQSKIETANEVLDSYRDKPMSTNKDDKKDDDDLPCEDQAVSLQAT